MALNINGEPIDDEIIESEFRSVKGHYERQLQVACCERDPEFRSMAKDNLISRALLNQEAKRRCPEVEPAAIDERLARLIEEAGGEDAFYHRLGMPFKDEVVVREQVAGGVRLDRMLQDIYGNDPQPNDEQLAQCHQRNAALFTTPERIHAAHITKGLQGAKSRSEVYDALRAVRRELLGGADFMTLAEQHRNDEQQSIDLGWFGRGEFMEEFEAIAFSMKPREISPVFTTSLGFHLCTVLEREEPRLRPLEEVRAEVLNRFIEEHKDGRFNALIEELKAAAKIEDSEPADENCGCAH